MLPHVSYALHYPLVDLDVRMLENDGRNERQLEWAGLSHCISQCVSHQLPAATTTSSSGVYDTESISLLLWLSWMTSTKGKHNVHLTVSTI